MPGSTRGQTEIPTEFESGLLLYNRQRNPLDPFWVELPQPMKDAWASCERYLAFVVGRLEEPSAPLPERETAIERHERHVGAVEAVLKARGMHLGQSVDSLRDAAEELLAAADTGI